jgi:hypothetical protein
LIRRHVLGSPVLLSMGVRAVAVSNVPEASLIDIRVSMIINKYIIENDIIIIIINIFFFPLQNSPIDIRVSNP